MVEKRLNKNPKKPKRVLSRKHRFVKYFVLPLAIYFLFFCIYSWPWIKHFNTNFFTDAGDGLQNVWNMWWVNKSVVQLHQLPWYTTYLHAPFGVTLVGQTLNPVNGFTGIILQRFMSLTQAFNIMVIFSFIASGLTMFWLCHYFTKNYVASIIGGAIFTFSSYHFAHAIGHIQLITLEFIPLYILFLWKLLKKPTILLSIGAAVSLLLVLFSDYYYFLYVVMLSVFIIGYLWHKKELADYKDRDTYLPWVVFIVLSMLIVAPLPIALLLVNKREALMGSHNARVFSTDAASPLVDGDFWRFNSLTTFYYKHVIAFKAESSVYMGLSVITLYIVALWKRAKIHKDMVFWLGVSIFFGVMSLGPRPLVAGHSVGRIPLPYTIMEHVIPGIKLSGMPVRMMAMVSVGSGVIGAMVLSKLNPKARKGKLVLLLFCSVLFIEMWPAELPFTSNTMPGYVFALRSLPHTGAVLDDAAPTEPTQLYHQTGDDQKMVLGYISRTPQKIFDKEKPLSILISQGKYDQLCTMFSLRYFTTPPNRPLVTKFPIVYQDNQAIIYDLKNSPKC